PVGVAAAVGTAGEACQQEQAEHCGERVSLELAIHRFLAGGERSEAASVMTPVTIRGLTVVTGLAPQEGEAGMGRNDMVGVALPGASSLRRVGGVPGKGSRVVRAEAVSRADPIGKRRRRRSAAPGGRPASGPWYPGDRSKPPSSPWFVVYARLRGIGHGARGRDDTGINTLPENSAGANSCRV